MINLDDYEVGERFQDDNGVWWIMTNFGIPALDWASYEQDEIIINRKMMN